MRPERLEMAGFAPFRRRVELDLSNLEVFALTGPTGAGKSSVIDAITFALYGSVPRYDRRSVEPVISLGMADARVSFEFAVESSAYRAARLVRRTPAGATTAEARLERDGTVIASGAAEVTQAVEELLGLSLAHFTRSVVLPQGEFASFLHDTPGGQQELVKALLDMGALDRVRTLAGERARTSTALAESATTRLDHLGDATEEAEARCRERLAVLEGLMPAVSGMESEIAEMESRAAERAKRSGELEARLTLVQAVSVPPEVGRLAEQLSASREAAKEAARALQEQNQLLEELEEQARSVPSVEWLQSASEAHGAVEAARRQRDAIDMDSAEKEFALADEAVSRAREAMLEARRELEEVRHRHAAHALVRGRRVGDPCPVCDRPLVEEPVSPPQDLEAAESLAAESATGHDEAVERRRLRESALAEARARHAAAVEAVALAERRIQDLPTPEELESQLARRQEMEAAIATARARIAEERKRETAARELLGSHVEAERRAWERFGEQRDKLALLEPPPPQGDDLALAWESLEEWARATEQRLREAHAVATGEATEATEQVSKLREELSRILADAGVGGEGAASTRLAAAAATARADLERIRERRREREAAETDRRRFSEAATVAHALADHLRANRFEAWLLEEALVTLLEGANGLLEDLTRGTYSLTLRGRAIEIIDHRNADERRSVRSLSGGETFLVSLALALSLGEQLMDLSERGGTRLEAIFLDEGFGTLDAETLETVTAVVMELAAAGRVVGVVTHVKELAEQVPVRFEIHPGPDGSTVHRVEAA